MDLATDGDTPTARLCRRCRRRRRRLAQDLLTAQRRCHFTHPPTLDF